MVQFDRQRREAGQRDESVSLHTIFAGNPGTGKTTVARILGRLYHAAGILPRATVKEVSRSDLVGEHVGETAVKTRNVIDEAMGGILFIDEAYTLVQGGTSDFGREAIDTLVKQMEDHRDELIVIAAGYDEPMREFVNANPGLPSRFPRTFHFQDYSPEQLEKIFLDLCEKGHYTVTDRAKKCLRQEIINGMRNHGQKFANARFVRNLFEKLRLRLAGRVMQNKIPMHDPAAAQFTEDDFDDISPAPSDRDALLAELDALRGLEEVKRDVHRLINLTRYHQRRREMGKKTERISLHSVFAGSPGTGKTTVAYILGKIYQAIGILPRANVTKVTRSDLVAGYIGQTAIKTQKKIDEAMGGILFIDEAYTLTQGGPHDFGQEAIDTLLEQMEVHRDELIVIAAGYDEPMRRFMESNEGLASRFSRTFHFDNYTVEQLMEILSDLCEKEQYTMTDGAKKRARQEIIQKMREKETRFGNAREVRNLFEKLCLHMADRIMRNPPPADDPAAFSRITEEDFDDLSASSIQR